MCILYTLDLPFVFCLQLRTDVLKVFNGKLEDFRTESQARRLNRLNSSDIAYEDHTGNGRLYKLYHIS